MRFLVDENLPREIAEALTANGHDAVSIVDTPGRGLEDLDVWGSAVEEDRIIVTLDLDFPLMQAPIPPGLVLIRVPSSFSIPSIVTMLTEFVENYGDEALGRITVLSPGRIRSRPF